MNWRWLVVVIALAGSYQYWTSREIVQPDGVLAANAPRQQNMSGNRKLSVEGYSVHPQAHFEIKARVLSRKNYYMGREADLSPVDFALGWGRMSDQRILDKFTISQSNRFYFWRAKELPIPRNEVISSSANMHMIPANSRVKKLLSEVHKGHVIKLKGYLVNVDAPDGWRWRSSLTRNDSGNGACELVWVEDIEIIG